jgi:hypothetical protein
MTSGTNSSRICEAAAVSPRRIGSFMRYVSSPRSRQCRQMNSSPRWLTPSGMDKGATRRLRLLHVVDARPLASAPSCGAAMVAGDVSSFGRRGDRVGRPVVLDCLWPRSRLALRSAPRGARCSSTAILCLASVGSLGRFGGRTSGHPPDPRSELSSLRPRRSPSRRSARRSLWGRTPELAPSIPPAPQLGRSRRSRCRSSSPRETRRLRSRSSRLGRTP